MILIPVHYRGFLCVIRLSAFKFSMERLEKMYITQKTKGAFGGAEGAIQAHDSLFDKIEPK